MKLLRVLFYAAFTLIGTMSIALADLKVEKLTTESGTRYLLLHGVFSFSDDFGWFLSAVAAHKPSFVIFDSPGGNPHAAMKLGRLIRAFELDTLQIKQLECSSACALAFLGGEQRMALAGSIGVHRTSFVASAQLSTDEAVAQIQESTADLLAYLDEMGVDAKLLQFALRYDQSDMRYLSVSEMTELRVVTANDATPAGIDSPTASYSPPTTPSTPALSNSERATAFVHRLVAGHGLTGADARALVTGTYAKDISYFGKSMTQNDVIADKQQYFERWPERSYRIMEETIDVSCQTHALCTVAGLYEWSVRSVPRNRKASGTARFSFLIKVDDNPLVLSENSEVIRRN